MRQPELRPIPRRFRRPTLGVQASSNALLVLSMVMFAAGFPAAEILLTDWSTMALSFARLCISVAGMMVVWLFIDGWRVIIAANWFRAMIVGGIGFGLGSYLLLFAQSISDPVTVAIMVTTMPITGMIIEVALDGRRFTLRLILGVAATVIGGIMATGANPQMVNAGAGALIALFSATLFTWGSRATVMDFPDLSSIGRSTITIAGALVTIGLIYGVSLALGLNSAPPLHQPAIKWVLLVYYALGALAISQVFWIMGVGRLGVGTASLHMNLTPFYVMLFMLAMGGTWQWGQVIGAAIVALGVFIAQLPRPIRRQAGLPTE